ncbi:MULTISPECIES: DUF2829 domain-containing protein [Burkholderia]|uniref:DUF2829 domain-containing protein n=1 Tax=Burkholderia contaminans TaxID=488447 RepID=A0A2S5DRG3_9BURK|nr:MULTISPECIES: DUF2829 domain-containing protein [Burkholderia]EKS9798247.1 DUF2829 domain-containing protein [Burkholderia cepacia]EKS9808394.1 DUF2829 domain-containing protein [Burkholderia cepacia]EKS9816004.1 DUF2829 domain-containing protein [Burkholderia cepacia]EKS9823598.1 DUF2829 domain-containing protein [Burkholderia cepacia]EKS9827326.1 DUF2829 domain-containing protein [Burkholderia cepacia]
MHSFKRIQQARQALRDEHSPGGLTNNAGHASGDFGFALNWLRHGRRVARTGWNGSGQFVYLVPPAAYPVQTGAAKEHFGAGSLVPYNAYFALKGVDDRISTWVPSVTDCLAQDWYVIE